MLGAELVGDRGSRRPGSACRWLTVATMTQSTWRASMPASARASRAAADGHHLHGLLGRRPSGASTMPERCWIHSSLESIASTISELGTTRLGPVGADAEDARRARRAGGRARRGVAISSTPSGCRRSSGWPGETGSPSSTSHSTTWPPWARGHLDPVAQAGDVADGGAGRQRAEVAGLGGDVEGALGRGDHHPPGRGGVDVAGLAVLVAERAGVVELVGGLEGEGLDALEGALGDAGQGAGRAASRGCR